ncbi:hypothetical protein [Blackfly microvirus SF02]|uniref:Uncharacterized protein n=1 Tax=Blackfly microvirus SF02 TaxID=2576452 RepID=A0A4P8PKR3_9VIRU|nr:hypothetical protein [Blackfly microvirus SF02]
MHGKNLQNSKNKWQQLQMDLPESYPAELPPEAERAQLTINPKLAERLPGEGQGLRGRRPPNITYKITYKQFKKMMENEIPPS